jgi:sulfite dehydrogenase
MRTREQKQRRTLLIRMLGAGAGLGASAALASVWRHPLLRAFGVDGSDELPDALPALGMARFPEKENLILLTDRPPQLETPLHYFRQDLTPNGAFFVRWHLSGLPTTVDLRTFRLNVAGHVKTPLSLSFHELAARFPAVSMVAVNQCSGNSRSYYDPRVPGGQWKHGAMGNARWTGVRLRDVLDAAGVRAGAMQVTGSVPAMPENRTWARSPHARSCHRWPTRPIALDLGRRAATREPR